MPKISSDRPNVPARWRPTGRKIWLEYADGRGEEANEWNWHRNAAFLSTRGSFTKTARPHKGMTVWVKGIVLPDATGHFDFELVTRRIHYCTHMPPVPAIASYEMGPGPIDPCLECYALQRLGVPIPDASHKKAQE